MQLDFNQTLHQSVHQVSLPFTCLYRLWPHIEQVCRVKAK